jgi:signal peptidase I
MKAAPASRLLRRASTIIGVLVAVAACAVPAQAGISSKRQLAAILSHTPAPHIVSEGRQMAQAEQAAASIPGAQAFWGVGQSMQPLYAPNTALVVKPVSYDEVKKGMTVVYVKKNGHVVAHSVIDEDRKGYVVQGVNNSEADPESVNEHNMIGVVVAAFSATDSQFRADLAKQVAAKDAVTLAANRG